MKIHVRIFPVAGLCDKTQELDILLEHGNLNGILAYLKEQLFQERMAADPGSIEKLMFLHNGHALDRKKDTVFKDGDELWLLPQLSGG